MKNVEFAANQLNIELDKSCRNFRVMSGNLPMTCTPAVLAGLGVAGAMVGAGDLAYKTAQKCL